MKITTILALFAIPGLLFAQDRDSEHARKTLEIFEHIIGIESSKGLGNVPRLAQYLADELIAAGFTEDEVEVVPLGETASLVVRYKGNLSSTKAPILFLGHMDVVEAYEKDWERPPFELTSDDTYFYARGTSDNKFGVTQLTSTFIRLKKEGFVPDRDLIIAFTGDEESGMATTKMLAYERDDLAEAEFALNSDAGVGQLDADGQAVVYGMQTAEKTYVTWELTIRNPGGHSSRPRPDNAIYELADAIKRIQAQRFPVRSTDVTRAFFRATGEQRGDELGDAMIRFADNPQDEGATDRLWVESAYVGMTRTTCIPTMLQGGHAENALPQSATVTVNCRVFPGVPVTEIEAVLKDVVANDAVEFRQLAEAFESPASELREDVVSAVTKAVHSRHPDVNVIGYMEPWGTDGIHIRRAGVPTFGVSSIFMKPEDQFAHGLNERVPVEAFYGALDHWTIIIKELAGNGYSP